MEDSKVIAKFKDKTLTEDQLDFYIPAGVPTEDSIRYAEQFIEKWIREQAVMDKALSEDEGLQARVAYKVENYRAKLIMHEYHAKMLETLDTAVPAEDVAEYYETNKDNFLSDQEYYSFFYLVTTKNEGIDQAARWMRSREESDLSSLREWAVGNTREAKIDSSYKDKDRVNTISKGYFGNLTKAPIGQLIQWNGVIQGKRRRYMFKMLDKVKQNDHLPLSLCEDRIKAILRNDRRVKLIDETEQKILKDAEAKNYIVR